MKIIGHRGAPGLALENTLPSFKKAAELGVGGIELDVRVTKDGQYVVLHDAGLERVGGPTKKLDELTYKELKDTPLHGKARVPLLRDILKSTGDIPVYVEIKVSGHTEAICNILDEFPGRKFYLGSFLHDVALECRKLRPDIPVFTAGKINLFSTLRFAKRNKMSGIGFYHIFLPVAYPLCKRAGLDIMVYPIGTSWILRKLARIWPSIWRTSWAARVLERRNPNAWDSKPVRSLYRVLFPDVIICTDHPERFIGKRS